MNFGLDWLQGVGPLGILGLIVIASVATRTNLASFPVCLSICHRLARDFLPQRANIHGYTSGRFELGANTANTAGRRSLWPIQVSQSSRTNQENCDTSLPITKNEDSPKT
jgi:hypothetical protein